MLSQGGSHSLIVSSVGKLIEIVSQSDSPSVGKYPYSSGSVRLAAHKVSILTSQFRITPCVYSIPSGLFQCCYFGDRLRGKTTSKTQFDSVKRLSGATPIISSIGSAGDICRIWTPGSTYRENVVDVSMYLRRRCLLARCRLPRLVWYQAGRSHCREAP